MSFEAIEQEIVKWSDASLRKLQALIVALRKLKETNGDLYPAGSLKHLYSHKAIRDESNRASKQRIPRLDEA